MLFSSESHQIGLKTKHEGQNKQQTGVSRAADMRRTDVWFTHATRS